jgi:hypothetical protein
MFAWGATMAETRENSIRYIKSGEIRDGVGKSRPFAKGAERENDVAIGGNRGKEHLLA